MAGNLAVHPAPGLGDLLPGFFVVPQNPITDAAPSDPSSCSTSYVPGIGDILPASFVVPQNPLKDYTMGQTKLIGQQAGGPGAVSVRPGKGKLNGQTVTLSSIGTVGDCGCGCGGHGGCGGGMGDINADFTQITADISAGNWSNVIQDPIMGFPLWGWAGAAVLAYMVLLAPSEGQSRYSRARRAVRSY